MSQINYIKKIILDWMKNNQYITGKFEIHVNAHKDRVVMEFTEIKKESNKCTTIKTIL